MNIHIVGIGGIGTSGLAQFLVHLKHRVTGSNMGKTEGTRLLEKTKIDHQTEHDANLVTPDIDLVLYSEAVPKTNPERLRADELKIPQKSYFEYLGELSAAYKTIAVVGTHGKTTTVGLLASGLVAAGVAPNVLMGAANPILSGGNFHMGRSDWLIVEACEYRENFRTLQPEIVLLTDIELDHTDYYTSLDQYLSAIKKVIGKAKIIICHKGARNTSALLGGFSGAVIYTDKTAHFNLQIPGEYNQENARLAMAAAHEMGNIDAALVTKGIESYSGGSRRQQYLGQHSGLHVYDDYGHHPTEISLTAAAIHSLHPGARLGLIFEPHQHARTISFFNDFLKSFTVADAVALWPIYAARDSAEDKQFTIHEFIKKDAQLCVVETPESAYDWAKNELTEGDVLLFMGAGVIDQVAQKVVALLQSSE